MLSTTVAKFTVVLRSGFLRDAAILSVATGFSYAIGILSLPVLTRVYGPISFGALAAFISISSLISYFCTMRAENIIVLPSDDAAASNFARLLLLGCATVGVVGTLVSIPAAALGAGKLIGVQGAPLAGLGLAAMLIGMSAVFRASAVRHRMFKTVAASTIARALIAFAFALAFGYLRKDSPGSLATGLILGQILGDLSACLMLGANQKDILRRSEHWYSSAIEVFHKFKGVLGAITTSQLLAAIYSPMAVIVVAASVSSHAAGIFTMAERVLVAPSVLLSLAIGEVFRQRAAARWSLGQDITKLVWRVRLGTALIAAPPYALIAIFGPALLALFLGEEWRGAGEICRLLAIVAFLSMIAGVTDRTALIIGASGYVAAWHGLRLVLESVCAAALWLGRVEFKGFVIMLAVARSMIFLIEIIYVHFAARRASVVLNANGVQTSPSHLSAKVDVD